MKFFCVVALALTLTIAATATAHAQQSRPRLQSRNGAWLLPVATDTLCSDEARHINRGSVRAWDLCMPFNSPVYPIAAGKVIYAGCNNAGGYGCWLMIDHGAGYTAIYAHMVEGSIRVRTGDLVAQNQQMGNVGWTGKTSFGPHTHLEIRRNGAGVLIGDYFDRTRLHDCPLCNMPKDAQPVVASGQVVGGSYAGQAAQPATLLSRLPGALAIIGADRAATVAVVLFVALCLLWWLGGVYMRTSIVAGVVSVSVSVAVVVLVSPQANANSGAAAAQGNWQAAYKFTAGSEGWECTTDPVRTFGGVTQGTYTRWRMSHGLGPADVCGALTELQRQQIFYEFFWVGSGANALPGALALTYVDHYFNTGLGKAGLAACGTNVTCFNNWRIQDYQSKGNANLYLNAWNNRVNRARKLTEDFQ